MCMRGSARCMILFGILTLESRYDVIVDQKKGFFSIFDISGSA